MALSDSFAFNFNGTITAPMQTELNNLYNRFLFKLKDAVIYYDNLKVVVKDILKEENNPPSVDSVDVLNSNLAAILVAFNDGGLSLGNLGNAVFGMNYTGFELDANTGKIKGMPVEAVSQLLTWIRNSIESSTNKQYLDSVVNLDKLMTCFDKNAVEKILTLIDSIIAANATPEITLDMIVKKLDEVGLSFTEDPNISKIDSTIPDLFVQKHLVTTKLYTAIRKKIYFIAGYDPDILNQVLDL